MPKARSYKSRLIALWVVGIGAAAVAGYLGSHILQAKDSIGGPSFVLFLLMGLTALAFAAGMPWWRKLDDLQRLGQLNAWYWGGQIGGLVVLLALVTFTGKSDYSRGALALFAGEFLGFCFFWLAWRLRSNGSTE
ncbi:MAG: hypothetical protein RL519_817 [Pseudomonadota bacterium]|jgi:hypothetical protein